MAPPVTAWLLLQVALLLDAVQAQGTNEFRMSPREEVVRVGDKVTLRCEVLIPNVPLSCSWLFQPLNASRSPTFLLYQSGSRTKLHQRLDPKRFTSARSGNIYSLTLSGFREEDEGYYFCSVSGNMMVYFSPFIPVRLPAAPTSTPAPPRSTPAPSLLSPSVSSATCVVGKGGAAGTRWLDLACDIYIWAPLAGTCGVLLLSLVITVVCYQRSKRRVCKCPRPQARPEDQPIPSGKLI